jgi:type IV pilus assembly protein PilC
MGSVDLSKIQKRSAPASGNHSGSSWSDWLHKDFSFTGKGLNDKKKEGFFLEVSILLGAGLDMKSTLDLLVADQRKPTELALFESIRHAVVQGKAFSEALQASKQFTLYEQCSIQIGEEIGKLPVILKELADYHQKKSRQKRQIVQALTYPGLVLGTSVASVAFMLHFIVPMFADVFKRFGGKLPWITQLILNISGAFSSYFWVWFGAMLLIGGFGWKNSKKVWFRKNGARVVLFIPLIGEIVRKIYLARFCQSMTLLISSRIPLLRATVLVRQMIGFYLIEEALGQVEQDILQGEFLHRSLARFTVFPNRMLSLVKVGEEVNQLDVFFEKIGSQYTEEVEHQTALIGSLLEPLMIVFLGFIVGFILVAMYLPLFQLSTTF